MSCVAPAPGGDALLDGTVKGLPLGVRTTLGGIGDQRWNVLRGDTATPVAVLREPALRHNIATMRRYCEERRLLLAPHGKTTMSPELVRRQLEGGAWGMTAATPRQVELMWRFGAVRVLLANELADPAALRWAAGSLSAHPDRELWCYVDSLAGVRIAAAAFEGADRVLPVLLEVGHPAGRTGVRSRQEARTVADAVGASKGLVLAGVAGFEGTLGWDRGPQTLAAVDAFVAELAAVARMLAADDAFSGAPGGPLVSAGGSLFFDRVADGLAALRDEGLRVVLRSGCYLAHDSGVYAAGTPSAGPSWQLAPFAPALEVWARVVSRPEPTLALVDAGRRDVSYDIGLPVPLAAVTRAGRPVDVSGACVRSLGDQHGFLTIDAESPLAVGDLVGLGISHPCTTFDRWQVLLLVDDAYDVVGAVRTYF